MNKENKEKLTLASLLQEKQDVLGSIANQKNKINNLYHKILLPEKQQMQRGEYIMSIAAKCFTAYDGIMTGMKLVRRVKSYLSCRK